jgi:shikimate kinase / 3-dehydroquinate synthase
MDTNVILTGFMGTGKSTVGRLLAARLGYDFVDTDELIVARDGRSIADIFRAEGQTAFRAWEARVAQELAGQRGLVIATGGRLMLDAANAAALAQTGPVFCLEAAPATILARLADDDGRRPLLDVPNPVARVRELLERRAEGYGRFPQISTDAKTPDAVAAEIVALLGSAVLTVSHPDGRYNVVVGRGLLPNLRALSGLDGPLAVITDSNVGPIYAAQIEDPLCVLTIPAGEEHKTLNTAARLYTELLAAGLDRQGAVVALGGGVVGDTAGFVAATYMRGVRFVQCPTSLLAMVDASVGGKTGVDLPEGKNLVGAFKQPTAVLADLDTLRTLSPEEFSAGLAEVIKHGLLADPRLFARLEMESWDGRTAPPAALQALITDAIQVKRDVVQADPFEQGRRALLNLGHTFAHAIEQVSGYAVRHGPAVGMGLVAAAHLSAGLGYCDAALPARVTAVVARAGLPVHIPAALDPTALYRAMGSDKKKAAGRLRFILLREIGAAFVADGVPETAVLDAIERCQK